MLLTVVNPVSPLWVQPVKSPVSKPGLVTRQASGVAVGVGVGGNVAVAVGVGDGVPVDVAVAVGVGPEKQDGNLKFPMRVFQLKLPFAA